MAYKQLSESLARAQNELATKAELQSFAKEVGVNLSEIKKDLKSLGADIKAVGETIASIEGSIHNNQPSDGTVPHDPGEQPTQCSLCDTYEYTKAIQYKDLSLGKMPYGQAQFDASKDKPWSLVYDNIDVKVKTIVGQQDTDNGLLVFYHTISTENKSRPELAGKEYKLKVVSSQYKQTTESTEEFYAWSPHLHLGITNGFMFGVGDNFYRFGADLGLTIMGYGRTKDDQEWRFIKLGIGLNTKENPYLTLEPVLYNIGKFLPLISDLWVSAGALYDSHWGIGLSIGTAL